MFDSASICTTHQLQIRRTADFKFQLTSAPELSSPCFWLLASLRTHSVATLRSCVSYTSCFWLGHVYVSCDASVSDTRPGLSGCSDVQIMTMTKPQNDLWTHWSTAAGNALLFPERGNCGCLKTTLDPSITSSLARWTRVPRPPCRPVTENVLILPDAWYSGHCGSGVAFYEIRLGTFISGRRSRLDIEIAKIARVSGSNDTRRFWLDELTSAGDQVRPSLRASSC